MTTLRRLTSYVEKVYGLSGLVMKHLREGRQRPQIGLADVVSSVWLLFALRLKSLNALEEVLRGRGHSLVKARPPSADTIGYTYERMHPEGLRQLLRALVALLRRKKALSWRGATRRWVVAIDGHELFASYQRECPRCRKRKVKTAEGPRIQSYHQVVVAQLVGVQPAVCLDVEPIEAGEDEVAAARRLLKRLLDNYPFVELFTFDAAYLEAPILKDIVEAKRGAIVVLKQEERALYKDALGLCGLVKPQEVAGHPKGLKVWDLPGLTSWEEMGNTPVRVVRTLRNVPEEAKPAVPVPAAQAGTGPTTSEKQRMWAAVGVDPKMTALEIEAVGRSRWDIENRAFNEQDRFYGLDHCYHHDVQAILNLILTLFLAVPLVELFFRRNIKVPEMRGMSLAGLARLLWLGLPLPGEPSIWSWAQAP